MLVDDMSDSYCVACYPNKVRSHRGIYVSELFDILLSGFVGAKPRMQLPRFPWWLSVTHFFYTLMRWFRVVSFSEEFNRTDHYPRSFIMIEEAKRLNLPIESISILGRKSTYYRVKFGSKRYYYDALPSRFLNFRLDEKAYIKKTLQKYAFPTPIGRMFWNLHRAMRYGKKLGFPLVVKPARGTHAYHVTAPVLSEEELRKAIILARKYQPRFIVERYLAGNLYRVTVINFNKVFVARREGPNIIGDGIHTALQLIELKNSDPRRGETGQKDATLHKIPLNSSTHAALHSAGVNPDAVVEKGKKIILHAKTSIGSGGDIIEETKLLHPENREMFRRAARLYGTDLVGFDVIAADLSRPYTEQECGIIEANSIPMIDFHHFPTVGEPQNVAGALWDAILADKRVRYLYPVMLKERSIWTRFMWHLLDVTMPIARDFMLKFRIVRKLTRRQKFLVGKLLPNIAPESAIAHLKLQGFEVVRPEWIDYGEIIGLRKLLDHERQCHIRLFDDGEVRAHVEYAPEARPIAHLLEQGLHAAHELVHEFLYHYIERHELVPDLVPEKVQS